MEKKFWVVANWKANKTPEEAKNWVAELREKLAGVNLGELEIVVCPPFTLLEEITGFSRGGQTVSNFDNGQFTGEVSAQMLGQMGTKYCLVGHSERRKHLGETNEDVEEKVKQCLAYGVTPIICAQSKEEIPKVVAGLAPEKYLLMFEPFSAISENGQYHPEEGATVQQTLESWPQGARLLYGGSVNKENVINFKNLPLVSGLVVGQSSLSVEDFFDIIKKCITPEATSV